MTYQEAVQYLFSATPVYQHVGGAAYKPGLGNTERLDAHYGHPHRAYPTIHIAGTNGKGSTSHTLSAILQAAGYRVGLFTSPHLVDFRERIRVSGQMISEDYVARFTEEAREQVREIEPSFFELTTLMALCYFRDMQVDVAIIEVGLGGRLDSTNIISPILSIITNISLDHTQYLGHTLREIATEKAGIIKPHTPVVIGNSQGEGGTLCHYPHSGRAVRPPTLGRAISRGLYPLGRDHARAQGRCPEGEYGHHPHSPRGHRPQV